MSGVDAVTLVLAILGFVLSVASLLWQFVSWRLSGPRVRVEMRVGATNGQRIGTVPVNASWRESLDFMAKQDNLLSRVLVAKIVNSGRQSTSVVNYSAAIDDAGMQVGVLAAPFGSPPLPHRLEAESQVSYYLDLNDLLKVLAALEASGQPAKRVRMRAELGSGRSVTSDPVPASRFWTPG